MKKIVKTFFYFGLSSLLALLATACTGPNPSLIAGDTLTVEVTLDELSAGGGRVATLPGLTTQVQLRVVDAAGAVVFNTTDTSAPYAFSVTGLSAGNHYFGVRALDVSDVALAGGNTLLNVTASTTLNLGVSAFPTITIDGALGDFTGATEFLPASTLADADFTSLKVTNDATNLYLGITSDTSLKSWSRNVYVLYQINDVASAGFPVFGELVFSNGETWASGWNPTGTIFIKLSEATPGYFTKVVDGAGTAWTTDVAWKTNVSGFFAYADNSAATSYYELKIPVTGLSSGDRIKFYFGINSIWLSPNDTSEVTYPLTFTPASANWTAKNHTPVTWSSNVLIK